MKYSIQRGENDTFHPSPNENICSIARMRKHSLFDLYNLYKSKIQNLKPISKKKKKKH